MSTYISLPTPLHGLGTADVLRPDFVGMRRPIDLGTITMHYMIGAGVDW